MRKKKTTRGEVVRFIGYMLALTINQEESVKNMWRTTSEPGDIYAPPAIGQHGMPKNRFETLRSLFGKPFRRDESDLNPNDPWRYCRSIVDLFNTHRLKLIVPSWLLEMDESMSAYLGAEGVADGEHANSDPIPHRSFVERKPEPLGAELKVICDGESGVFLQLELQEGETAMSQKVLAPLSSCTHAHALGLTTQCPLCYSRTPTSTATRWRAAFGSASRGSARHK